MKKLLILPLVAFGLAACGNKQQLQSAANSPQAKKDEKEAQAIIQGCLPKGNLVTAKGRQAIVKCIAPPNHQAALQSCVTKALTSDGVLTSKQRKRFYQGLTICVEKNR